MTTTEATTFSGSSTSSLPTLDQSSAGKRLTLADFFQPESYWTENRFDVADKGQIQGISHLVNSCSEGDPETLELRLRNYFKTLDFSVGQDNNSQGSNQVLMVAIYGNGAQVDIKRVPFNKVQNFSVSVQDVNALQLRFFLDRKVDDCGRKTANVVVYDLKLTS